MRALRLAALALLCAAGLAHAQRPRTTIVVLAPHIADALAREYDSRQEQVWKVTAFDSTARDGYTLITVRAVEYAGKGGPHEIPESTLAGIGSAPLIHTHALGNCQASPFDKEAAAQRMARFDGILCGDRYTTWYFAADIVAVENYRAIVQELSTRQD